MSSKVKCAYCKNFIPKDEAVHIGIQNFCDMYHVSLYQDRTRLQQKGEYKAPTPKKTDAKSYAECKKRDNGRCRVCGTAQALHVHHILYRSEITVAEGRDNVSNLITLCLVHHDMMHSDKKLWQPVLKEAARLRDEEGKLVPVMTLKRRMERHDRTT